jgi:hypothetical protein
MRQKSDPTPVAAEKLVRDIRRATRKQYLAEEKIRIVLDGLRGESSIAELFRRENIAESLCIQRDMNSITTHLAATPRCPFGKLHRGEATGGPRNCLLGFARSAPVGVRALGRKDIGHR